VLSEISELLSEASILIRAIREIRGIIAISNAVRSLIPLIVIALIPLIPLIPKTGAVSRLGMQRLLFCFRGAGSHAAP